MQSILLVLNDVLLNFVCRLLGVFVETNLEIYKEACAQQQHWQSQRRKQGQLVVIANWSSLIMCLIII